MLEQTVRVETYSGFKADERPLRLRLGECALEVVAVEDRWYSPGETYFRVLTDDGDRYILRHTEAQDVWTLSAYRAETRRARGASQTLGPSFLRKNAGNGRSQN